MENENGKRPSSAIASSSDNETSRIDFVYTGQDNSDIPRNITQLRIDISSVKTIGKEAFKGCSHLAEVDICEGVEVIEKDAFESCKSLKFIRIPSSCKVVKDAFSRCEKLEGVELCEGIEKIDGYTFWGCTELKSITIPSTLRSIKGYSFPHCPLETIVLTEGIEKIEKEALRDNDAIKSIKIPSSVESIGPYAFIHNRNLEEVELCEGLEEIGQSAFYNCNLKSIYLPSTIKKMGRGAFGSCSNMKKAVIGDGSKKLFPGTFSYSGISSIQIPSSVQVIGGSAFSACKHLVSIELHGSFTIKKFTYDRGEDMMPGMKKTIFEDCKSLRNVFLDTKTPACFDGGCHDLMRLFGSTEGIVNGLKSRFDGAELAVHKLCYFQSYQPVDTLEGLRKELNGASAGVSRDSLGMTPLHILACSAKPNLAMIKLVLEYQPQSLTTKDEWRSIPLLYAIWIDSSPEVVQLLVDSHMKEGSTLNWDGMIETLCRHGVHLDILRRLLVIKQESFQDQHIDWQKASKELTICALVRVPTFNSSSSRSPAQTWQDGMGFFFEYWDAMLVTLTLSQELTHHLNMIQQKFFSDRTNVDWRVLCEELIGSLSGWWKASSPRVSFKSFQFLIECDIPKRLDSIVVRKWHTEIKDLIEEIPSLRDWYSYWEKQFHLIHSKLISYEPECRFLTDASSLLELALWKAKVSERGDTESMSADEKVQCRSNCGANIVIPNVLPFIMSGSDGGYIEDDYGTDCDSSYDY